MDINLMALNVGNSRLALGVFSAGELIYTTRVPNTRQSDWTSILAEAWARIAGNQTPAVTAASVNPPLAKALDEIVRQATGQEIQWIGSDIALPIRVKTENPAQTGVDRVLNIAAAFEQMAKACVVVDAGSAITVDCCNDQGDFLGGAIAPGVEMMLEALHEKTAGLPRVNFETPTGAFGQSTSTAISQGIYYAARGLVRDVVENFATELGTWPDIIATGGDAPRLFGNWELVHAVAPDLTLYGIAHAYAEHHIRRAR